MIIIRVNSVCTMKKDFKYNIDVEVKLNINISYSVQNLQIPARLFFVNLNILRKNLYWDKVSGLVSPSAIISFMVIYQFQQVFKDQFANLIKLQVYMFDSKMINRVDSQLDYCLIIYHEEYCVQIRSLVFKPFQTTW